MSQAGFATEPQIAAAGGRLLRASQAFTARFWRALFVLMLVLLHLAAMRGAEDFWARALMMAHFGLFILWQPFMRGEHRLTLAQTVAIAAISAGILLFMNGWLLALWTGVLAGIVGGKVFLFQARWLRRFYMVVLLYVVSLLLVWIVPLAFQTSALDPDLWWIVQYGLPALFVAMALMPLEPEAAESPQVVDFLYATLIFLLLVVLALGSFAFMSAGTHGYGESLSYTLLIIAAVLLALSLAWNPRAGFAGLSMYFSRYLLSIGLPFEQWLHFLAELSQIESRPERFLKEACAGLAQLPWVSGGIWSSSEDSGEFGAPSAHTAEFTNAEIHLRVFTRQSLSPSLQWHFHLLGQMLGEFYLAKLREEKLQRQTYVQAVHETGARMTHDVKNLLQSLNVLCAAAGGEPAAGGGELDALIRRQLPAIAQRLQQTLDKLQKPQTDSGRFVQASVWWEGLQRGYQGRGIAFAGGEIQAGLLLPKELFDSAADNLLQNALRKHRLDGTVSIRVAFRCAGAIELSVCDSGLPVDPEVVRGLLRGPVASESGFGIGLYQSARLAEMSGYALTLSANEPGNVCFALRGASRTGGDR